MLGYDDVLSDRIVHIRADAVLLDIEGTIGPISFVRDVLFAYAKSHLTQFVDECRDDPVVQSILQQASDWASGADPVETLLDWQERDLKHGPLKKLQGLIWDAGYRSGAFQSVIYPDALTAIAQWHATGLPIYVYSSGSEAAQLNYFEFNGSGDLRPLFRRHFDTEIGSKVVSESYARIAKAIATAPAQIVFFTDSPAELAAAENAGLQAVGVVRDGRTGQSMSGSEIVDFSSVRIERSEHG